MEASFFLPPLRDGRCGPMRGALPLRKQVGRLGSYSPKWRGCAPTPPIGRALRPIPREFMQGWQPLHPPCGRSAPRPGLLSRVEKVGKDTPRAVPFGIPRCVVTALFALAALRSGSRRATFSH